MKSRTFFFVDYQGQRQNIGRTVISTVPTVLQRQGVFTEAIGGRVPTIFDPASGTADTRTAFPGSTDSDQPNGSGRGVAAAALPAAHVCRHRQQLPPHRHRRRRSEPVVRQRSITISRATGTRRLRGSPGSREHSRR